MAADYIDELCFKIGLDPGELQQGLRQVLMAIESVNSEVKGFGEGMTEGLTAAETGAGEAGEAVAGLADKAEEAGKAVEKIGRGKKGLTEVKDEARKTGKAISDVDKKADRLGKRLGKKLGMGFSRFLMGLAAPVLGMLAAGSIIKKYTDDLEKLDELSKKRNLSLKEREERQKLLKEYSEKDLENYRQTKKAVEFCKAAVSKLGGELMKFAGPYIRGALERLREFADFLNRNHRFVKILAGVIATALIPVLWSLAAAFLANPLTWIIAGLAALALAVEDLWVYLNGGESALGGFWEALGFGEGTLESLQRGLTKVLEIFGKYGPKFIMLTAGFFAVFKAMQVIHSAFTGFKLLAGGIGLVSNALKLMKVAMASNPILLIAMLLAIAAMAIMENWDSLAEFFTGLWERIKGGLTDLWEFITGVFSKLGDFFKGIFDSIKGAVIGQIKGIIDKIPNALLPDSVIKWANEVDETAKGAGVAMQGAAAVSPAVAAGNVDQSQHVKVDSQNNFNIYASSDPAAIGAAAGDAVQRANANTFNSGVRH